MTGTHIIMRFMVLMGMRMALACTCHCSHKAVPLSSAHTGSHWVSKCNGSVMCLAKHGMGMVDPNSWLHCSYIVSSAIALVVDVSHSITGIIRNHQA